jgi:mono/diheme cytochrome c family protein
VRGYIRFDHLRLVAATLGLAAIGGLLAAGGAATGAATGDVGQGRTYYRRYCASCHGMRADGSGPVAPVLSKAPADLRLLSRRYGYPLPADKIAGFVDGRTVVPAHGDRDMPVWGERFNEIPLEGAPREAEIHSRIAKIIAYLQTIQLREHKQSASGAGD